MIQGQLTKWDDDRGFGFVTPSTGGDPIFLHIGALKNTPRRPHVGDIIHFEVEVQADGRSRARNARIEGVVIMQPSYRPHRNSSKQTANFVAILALLVCLIPLSLWLNNVYRPPRSTTAQSQTPNYFKGMPSSKEAVITEQKGEPEPVEGNTQTPTRRVRKHKETSSRTAPPPEPHETDADKEPLTIQEERGEAPGEQNEGGALIKGNISVTTGKKWYHLPGMRDYDNTVIGNIHGERWFRTEEEAIAAGWTKAPGY